jgi:hypothetical protein
LVGEELRGGFGPVPPVPGLVIYQAEQFAGQSGLFDRLLNLFWAKVIL